MTVTKYPDPSVTCC